MFLAIANAIALEAMFNVWCGENYELFHDPRGQFPGIGTPREIFRRGLPKLFNQAMVELKN